MILELGFERDLGFKADSNSPHEWIWPHTCKGVSKVDNDRDNSSHGGDSDTSTGSSALSH